MAPQRFHTLLLLYLDEYRVHLSKIKSNSQTTSYCIIISEFTNYLYNPNLVGGIDQITVSMACSNFFVFHKRRKKEVVPKEVMKKILKGYFVFLDGKYGMRNETLMRGLDR